MLPSIKDAGFDENDFAVPVNTSQTQLGNREINKRNSRFSRRETGCRDGGGRGLVGEENRHAFMRGGLKKILP